MRKFVRESVWAPILAIVAIFGLIGVMPASADPARPRIIRGPSSSTNRAVGIYSGTTGQALLNSLVTIDSSGNISLPASATVDGVDVSSLSGVGGDVVGPPSATDNAIARYDLTTGKLLQSSSVVIDDSNRIGFGTTVPTHTVTLASTATGICAHNQSDQVTNYERARMSWASNVFEVMTEAAGSGTVRSARFGSSANYITLAGSGAGHLVFTGSSSNLFNMGHGTSGIGVVLNGNVTSAATPNVTVGGGATMNGSSAAQVGFRVTHTVNQTSTAGYDAVLIDPTLTAVGSTGGNFIRAKSGATDIWRVSTAGKVHLSGTITGGGTTGAQTINKTSGTVNFAASATSLVVTNSLVSASTIVKYSTLTNDANCYVKNAVAASGSFTITMVAACAAETKVYFELGEIQ